MAYGLYRTRLAISIVCLTGLTFTIIHNPMSYRPIHPSSSPILSENLYEMAIYLRKQGYNVYFYNLIDMKDSHK